MIRLIRPTIKYKKSFIAGAKEFYKEKNIKKGWNPKKLEHKFPDFVRKMRGYENDSNLPASYYWLVDKSEFIGETTIRYKLNRMLMKEGGHIGYGIRPTKRKMGYGIKILALALKKAKKLGIKKVLLTCNSDNAGSQKIIEVNGGVFKDKIRHKGKLELHYWIKLK